MSGVVVHTGTKGECAAWGVARGDDRSLLLRHNGVWAVVDVRGSVFEWANGARSEGEANVHVGEHGWVEMRTDVEVGGELVWWYGDAFGMG
jgi:hypothetical protein